MSVHSRYYVDCREIDHPKRTRPVVVYVWRDRHSGKEIIFPADSLPGDYANDKILAVIEIMWPQREAELRAQGWIVIDEDQKPIQERLL